MTTASQILEDIKRIEKELSLFRKQNVASTQEHIRKFFKDDTLVFDYTKHVILMSEEVDMVFPEHIKVKRITKENWKLTGQGSDTCYIVEGVFGLNGF